MYSLIAFCLAVLPIHEMAETDVDVYLKALGGRASVFSERVEQVARDSLGTAYANGPLGEGPSGKYDQDPLMDLGKADCVTYIEQTVALAATGSHEAALDLLQHVRYKGGVVDYESRNHFMISDWVVNNPWCRDVSGKLGVETAEVVRLISRRDYFQLVKAPEVGQDTPDQTIGLRYVPVAQASAAETQIPRPSVIVFIGRKPEWLFALHTGLFIDNGAGQGRLFHASSKAGKVVEMDLSEYVEGQSARYLGFTAYAIVEPPRVKVGDCGDRSE